MGDQTTDAPEMSIDIDTPERFKHLIGRKNDKELFGMPPGSVTIERIRECAANGALEIRMTYRVTALAVPTGSA
jgi:hypothetical protein